MRPRWFLALAAFLLFGAGAEAQFGDVPSTNIVWYLDGELVLGEGAPTPEAGDQIGAFFGETLVGVVELTASQATAREYSELIVFGDNPATLDEEGPSTNDVITFQYYDESTNSFLTNVRALNSSGEATNLAYQGGERITIPVPVIPPDELNANRRVNLRIGTGSGGGNNGGGGNGGGGELPTGDPDVDGDGRVTKMDAAMVLRVVTGSTRTLPEGVVGRADVNGDGTVSTDDAIAVLRAR